MEILFKIGNIQFHTYAVFCLLGAVLGGIYLLMECKKKGLSFLDEFYVYTLTGLGAGIFAKIFYLLIKLSEIRRLLESHPENRFGIIMAYSSGGMMLYGGIFGGILGIFVASKVFKTDPATELNLFAPVFALGHGIIRIGCAIVGCCYGRPYSGPLSVKYVSSHYAPNNMGLFPVQITESLFSLILFTFLALCSFKGKFKNELIHIYLISYAIGRFILEYLRGDNARGSFSGLSTSQWIGVGILVFECIYIWKKRVFKPL